MFGTFDTKVYLFFTLITTVALYAIDLFDKNEVVKTFLLYQGQRAEIAGLAKSAANLIVIPLAYAVDNPLGAIIAGLLWPVLGLWLLLLVMMMAYSVLLPGMMKALCTADSGC